MRRQSHHGLIHRAYGRRIRSRSMHGRGYTASRRVAHGSRREHAIRLIRGRRGRDLVARVADAVRGDMSCRVRAASRGRVGPRTGHGWRLGCGRSRRRRRRRRRGLRWRRGARGRFHHGIFRGWPGAMADRAHGLGPSDMRARHRSCTRRGAAHGACRGAWHHRGAHHRRTPSMLCTAKGPEGGTCWAGEYAGRPRSLHARHAAMAQTWAHGTALGRTGTAWSGHGTRHGHHGHRHALHGGRVRTRSLLALGCRSHGRIPAFTACRRFHEHISAGSGIPGSC